MGTSILAAGNLMTSQPASLLFRRFKKLHLNKQLRRYNNFFFLEKIEKDDNRQRKKKKKKRKVEKAVQQFDPGWR